VCFLIKIAFTSVTLVGQSKASIQGVWRVVEVTTTGPHACVNKNPQPGLYIFTAKHYNILRDTSREVRGTVNDLSRITAEEALATFGPLMAQSGTYEVSGSVLRGMPIVAKVRPAEGKYGASNTRSFKIDGDTLWMTQLDDLKERLSNSTGAVTNPTTVRLVRVE
jgi:hypothetical protein